MASIYAICFGLLLYYSGIIPGLATLPRILNLEMPRSFPLRYTESVELLNINNVNYPPAVFSQQVLKSKHDIVSHANSKLAWDDQYKVRWEVIGGGRTSEAWSPTKHLLGITRSDLSLVLIDLQNNRGSIWKDAAGPTQYIGVGYQGCQLTGWMSDSELLSINTEGALSGNTTYSDLRRIDLEKKGSASSLIATDCNVPLLRGEQYLSPNAKYIMSCGKAPRDHYK